MSGKQYRKIFLIILVLLLTMTPWKGHVLTVHGKEPALLDSSSRNPLPIQSSQASVTAVIELSSPPVAAVLKSRQGDLSAPQQIDLNASLRLEQEPVVQAVRDASGLVISRYTKVYNGLLVRIPASRVHQLLSLPGVKAVHRAPYHVPILDNSVPTIRGDEVADTLGFDGSGISIGIIDTGIDYTHKALGGSGDPDDYTNNDPTTIADGGFPNAKVVGGYDFVGSTYTGEGSTPVPDEDPLDEYSTGHGTHVASTAAGLEVPYRVGKGTAPGADLYALKVFGPSGGTHLTADAIEWAVDPNNDGDLTDHLDIINLSLGTTYGPADPDDPAVVAINNAVDAGVVVVSSVGNDGDIPYVVGSPASASGAISVAASNSAYQDYKVVQVPSRAATVSYISSLFDNDTGHFDSEVTGDLFTAGESGTGTTTDLCDITGLDPALMIDQVALIERGGCGYSAKVENAFQLGAVAALIYDTNPEGMIMTGDPVSIPAASLARSDGLTLAGMHGESAVISAESENQAVPENIKAFSSRGPRGFDSHLKPEITAPGYPIYAAKKASGIDHIGFQGTSMAAPHVAGAAALVLQAHPQWLPIEIKAVLMNRSQDLDDNSPVPRAGAGRVDAYRGVSAEVAAYADPYLVSLSWGWIPAGDTVTDSKTVTFKNLSRSEKTYLIDWDFDSASLASGVQFTHPAQVTVPDQGSTTISIQLEITPSLVPASQPTLEEYSGYFTFTNVSDSSDVMRLPFYLVPRPYSTLSDGGSDPALSFYGDPANLVPASSGPIAPDLDGIPVMVTDPEDPAVGDEADLRLIGLDYQGLVDTNQDSIPDTDAVRLVINVFGQWHTPQPLFSEFRLFVDIDEDGSDNFLLYNTNLEDLNGSGSLDDWVVAKKDLSTHTVSLASPFPIKTDYNSGLMEWILPTTGSYGFGLDPVGSGGNTDFAFYLESYDYDRVPDSTLPARYDTARPPFSYLLTASAPSGHSSGDLGQFFQVTINDPIGYHFSRPTGFMAYDWNAQPGSGQALLWLLSVEDSRGDTADFDGDGDTDISVYRPSNGNWYIYQQGYLSWGLPGDLPVPGDYNGDETVDVAVYRPANQRWYIRGQGNYSWGQPGDIPVPCDYDGDGTSNLAVFRPSIGNWYIKTTGGVEIISLGLEDDIPVPEDYDGDGACQAAVYRPSTGEWIVAGNSSLQWGFPDDIPVPGDYDGDGAADIAVFRPSNGKWYIKGSGYYSWGLSGDQPVPGDYNGDGTTEIAVLRPSNGKWYIRDWGQYRWYLPGDYPLPVRYTKPSWVPYP